MDYYYDSFGRISDVTHRNLVVIFLFDMAFVCTRVCGFMHLARRQGLKPVKFHFCSEAALWQMRYQGCK